MRCLLSTILCLALAGFSAGVTFRNLDLSRKETKDDLTKTTNNREAVRAVMASLLETKMLITPNEEEGEADHHSDEPAPTTTGKSGKSGKGHHDGEEKPRKPHGGSPGAAARKETRRGELAPVRDVLQPAISALSEKFGGDQAKAEAKLMSMIEEYNKAFAGFANGFSAMKNGIEGGGAVEQASEAISGAENDADKIKALAIIDDAAGEDDEQEAAALTVFLMSDDDLKANLFGGSSKLSAPARSFAEKTLDGAAESLKAEIKEKSMSEVSESEKQQNLKNMVLLLVDWDRSPDYVKGEREKIRQNVRNVMETLDLLAEGIPKGHHSASSSSATPGTPGNEGTDHESDDKSPLVQ